MLAAQPWWQSPTTLNVVSALGTMLGALVAAWALIAAGPRYRLLYGPLRRKKLADDTWKVSIYMSSRGRRDIKRDAFDEGKPVEVNIGVDIRSNIEGIWSSQQHARMVDARVDGTCLLVGPSLINRRQDLRFTVLTAAKPPKLTCTASLIDVSIRRSFLTPLLRGMLASMGGALVFGTAFFLTISIIESTGVKVQGGVIGGIYLAGLLVIVVWAIVRFRTPTD
jgi:hypothetical protein